MTKYAVGIRLNKEYRDKLDVAKERLDQNSDSAALRRLIDYYLENSMRGPPDLKDIMMNLTSKDSENFKIVSEHLRTDNAIVIISYALGQLSMQLEEA